MQKANRVSQKVVSLVQNGRKSTKYMSSVPYMYHIGHLRKHDYSNILVRIPPKKENFQIKNSDILDISAQNIYCGYSLEQPRRGGSNEYPQYMFLSRNKRKIIYTQ